MASNDDPRGQEHQDADEDALQDGRSDGGQPDSGGQVDRTAPEDSDAPGAGIARGHEPAEPNEPG